MKGRTPSQLNIPPGAQVFVGAPANPMPRDRLNRLRDMVKAAPGVDEAHLPQCFIIGLMSAPAQVLVVIGRSIPALARALEDFKRELPLLLDGSEHLDVWPLAADDAMVATVRRANCQILARVEPSRGLSS
jgi:hypothetical protein